MELGVGLAAAGLATAAFVDLSECGGQQRLVARQPGQTGLQLHADLGWVLG
jgi:hypothetical protein